MERVIIITSKQLQAKLRNNTELREYLHIKGIMSPTTYPPGVMPTDLHLCYPTTCCGLALPRGEQHDFWWQEPEILQELMDQAPGMRPYDWRKDPELDELNREMESEIVQHEFRNWIEIQYQPDWTSAAWVEAYWSRQYALDVWGDQEEENNCPLDEYDDFLESLVHERIKNSEVNLHRLLSTPHEDRGHNVVWNDETETQTIKPRYCKDRIKCEVTIKNSFPEGEKGGYAVGVTDYGLCYIPEKFRGYIPEVGEKLLMTTAVQDIVKQKRCPLTSIFSH